MEIKSYRVKTCMGSVDKCLGNPLPFLSPSEMDELDRIGYTGKNSNGEKTTRTEYLDSLNKGKFQIDQIKFDNGDFSEEFIITRSIITPRMTTKIRLIVTNVCNRKCPGCCNVGWKGPQPKPMTIDDVNEYDTVLITGGEPLLYPEKVIELMDQFEFQNVILYTASMCDEELLTKIFFHSNLSGITYTIHDQKGLDEFEQFNKLLKSTILPENPSLTLRLNIFPSDVVLRPMDFSRWNVKLIDWVVDCPLPVDEDFGILAEPWGGKQF